MTTAPQRSGGTAAGPYDDEPPLTRRPESRFTAAPQDVVHTRESIHKMADRLNAEPRPIVVGTIPRLVRPLPFGCVRPRRDRRYPAGVREFVYERDGYRCVRCHTDELLVPQGDDPGSLIVVRGPLTLHHVMPHVMGGCSHPHNLVTLCSSCNTRLGAEGRYLA